jgi:hypothetical protein
VAALADGTKGRSPSEKIPELRGLVVLELRLGSDLDGEWQDAAVRVLLHSEHLFRFCLLGSTSVNPIDEEQPENNQCQTIGSIFVEIFVERVRDASLSWEVQDAVARSNKSKEKHPGHNDNEPHQCGVHVGKRLFLHNGECSPCVNPCANQYESDKQTRTVAICNRYEIELRAPMQSNERRIASTVITRNKQLLRLAWPRIMSIG